MNPISNILVIVDPTAEQHPSIRKAALLARRFEARLELFVCETEMSKAARWVAHSRKDPRAPFVVSMKAVLEDLAAPLRHGGLDVTTATSSGDPLYEALLEKIRCSTADLVVKDTHHHSLAQRTFLSNTDWQLIRDCPVPLLLTKPTHWSSTPRIVAALDPGHANDKPAVLDYRILDYASSLSRQLGGDLHVVHAHIPVAIASAAAVAAAGPPIATILSAEELEKEKQQKRGEVMDVTAEYRVDPANIHLEIGVANEVLPRLARGLYADVVAMGAISRRGLQRIFIGSTAEDVLERLPCDALIVKPPDFATSLTF